LSGLPVILYSIIYCIESLKQQNLILEIIVCNFQSISPGLVDTEMVEEVIPGAPMLKPSNIADAIEYVLAAPQYVNVNFI